MNEKILVLVVFVLSFGLILYRKIPIYWVSLGAAAVLIVTGIMPLGAALTESVTWDALAIYFGYGILAVALEKSGLPKAAADLVVPKLRTERYALFFICALAAGLSSFMPNPVVVLMLAPLAIEIAERMKSSLFLYLVSLAISSNVVTTVSMVADPPALILATSTGMSFTDFYWFMGRPGLGTLSVAGVTAALLVLLFRFRKLDSPIAVVSKRVAISGVSKLLMAAGVISSMAAVILSGTGNWTASISVLATVSIIAIFVDIAYEKTEAGEDETVIGLTLGPSAVFVMSVAALAILPNETPGGLWGIMKYQGWLGLALGLMSLVFLTHGWRKAIMEYDWQTIFFLIGIFIVIGSVDRVGLLGDFADWLTGSGLTSPFLLFTLITWLSVALSSFIDNVPYTVLMIPVCGYLAERIGISPFYFYFGMLAGTGVGGNITPVGATANVLACGMLEKRGIPIDIRKYMGLSVPFTVAAVLTVQILVQIFWG